MSRERKFSAKSNLITSYGFQFSDRIDTPKMKLNTILATFLLLIVSNPAPAQSESPAPAPAVEEIYLAKDDGKGRAGEQVTEFTTTDVPIYCVVLLETGEKTVVKMNFVAVSVPGVKPDTKVVTASYTTRDGQNRVNFTGRPDGVWTAGKYRVDLFLDGKLVRNLEFVIRGRPNAIEATYLQPARPAKPKPARAKKPN